MYTLELYIEEWKDWVFHCKLRTAKQIMDKRIDLSNKDMTRDIFASLRQIQSLL